MNTVRDEAGTDGPNRVVTKSADETVELGKQFGVEIHSPMLILLQGELGAGKTAWVRGLAAGLGIDPEEVSSPSFTLINLYRGRLSLYHIDLYRIADAEPIEEQLGLREILSEHAVVAVEWGERLKPQWQAGGWLIKLRWLSESSREIVANRITRIV